MTPKCQTGTPPSPLFPWSFNASGAKGHPSSTLTRSHKQHTHAHTEDKLPGDPEILRPLLFCFGWIAFTFSVQLESEFLVPICVCVNAGWRRLGCAAVWRLIITDVWTSPIQTFKHVHMKLNGAIIICVVFLFMDLYIYVKEHSRFRL